VQVFFSSPLQQFFNFLQWYFLLQLADDRVSPTIEVVLLLQGKTSGTTDKDGAISTRFLVPSKHIGCLLGKGGNIISEMRKQTRANIRIFRKDERPICVSENEELVQVSEMVVACF